MKIRFRSIVSLFLIAAGGLVLAGCSGTTSNANNGGGGTTNSGPQSSLSATSLTFASTNIGSSSATQSVTVTNTGTGPLSITTLPVSSDTTDFPITTTCTSALAAGANCTITVTFKPAVSGSLSATVTFADNSGNQTNVQHSIALTGSGTGPLTTLSSSSLTFSTTNIGSASAAQIVTVTNSGNATLTIGSIVLADTTNYAMTTTCGSSLGASANCTITVTFKPSSATTFASKVTLTDNSGNGTNIAHTITLSGMGALINPTAILSASSVSFASTRAGTTSATQTVTLTNTGTNPLTVSSIALGGTNPTAFTETNNCGTSVAYNTSCTITVAFAPTLAQGYSATVTLTDNAATTTQTIALTGTGVNATSTSYLLYELPDPGSGYGSGTMAKLYSLVTGATSTIDMTMYELQDTTFTADLTAACARGVKVRVILDLGEMSSNAPAYASLTSAGSNCSAVYSNVAFSNTHEKSIMIDGTTIVVMSLNLQSQYYSTTRDYAMVYNDLTDLAADEATFAMDYAAGNGGVSDFSYAPGPGSGDLIWSPTTALADMVGIIANAKSTLRIENEEFSSPEIISAVSAACQRGVTVQITIENEGGSYTSGLNTIKSAGCAPHVYTSSTGFYVHAKAVVADYGLSTQNAYMGSINYTDTSMQKNRELGMYISDAAAVQLLYTTIGADYAGGATF